MPVVPPKAPSPAPAWLQPAILASAALLILCWMTPAVSDSDTWWHLKTGQYIAQQHRLPVPDLFAYTTYLGDSYPSEGTTRYFNLTHEWLAQLAIYGAYAAGGFGGMVILRSVCLTAVCGLLGLLVYRRTRSMYRALAAALAVAVMLLPFRGDRPQYFSYLFLALTLNLLEAWRTSAEAPPGSRPLPRPSLIWAVPPLFLIWANCHAGFFLGWVVVGIYAAESLYLRWRGRPIAGDRSLWFAGISAILLSAINPNGLRVIQVMRSYRNSPMQTHIWEWQYPKFWELTPFTVLLFGGLLVLLLNRRRVRPADWLLFAAFGAAGLLAMRNIILCGLASAFLIAVYFPEWKPKLTAAQWVQVLVLPAAAFFALIGFWQIAVPMLVAGAFLWMGRSTLAAECALGVLLLGGVGLKLAQGGAFQFHASDSNPPADAADFLIRHNIRGKLFNTYGQGGYLIWRLWPQFQVFNDGRALSEKAFQDAVRIAGNAEPINGKSGEELLQEYGIDIIVIEGFEATSGAANYLPAALADPKQTEWKLVFHDVHDSIYMRHPPPDVPVLRSFDALAGMEEQCLFLVDNGTPRCTLGMIDVFTRIGDQARVRKWTNIYRNAHVVDTFTTF